MPNTRHRKKTLRKSRAANEANRAKRASMRTAVKRAKEAIATVVDLYAPNMTYCPPQDIRLCGDDVDPSVTGVATAVDNCDSEPEITWRDDIDLEFEKSCSKVSPPESPCRESHEQKTVSH